MPKNRNREDEPEEPDDAPDGYDMAALCDDDVVGDSGSDDG